MLFYPKSPLFDEAGEANAGGGTATTDEQNAGAGEGQQAQEAQQPQALTVDALKELLKTQHESTIREVTKQINGLDAKVRKELEKQKPKDAPKPETMTAEQLMADKERDWTEKFEGLKRERDEEKAKAQQREMDGDIKSALSDFAWQTDAKGASEGRDVAFTYYRSLAQRDDDGQLVIGTMPLQAYIKEHAARAFKNYHATRNIGGSGNSGSKGTVPTGVTAEILRQKTQSGELTTPEERRAMLAEILPLVRRA